MVDFGTVFTSVGLSVLGSILITEYRLRRKISVEESVELKDWYSDSAGYATEVRRIWQRLFDTPERPSVNLSEIQSEMSLLEGQISRHASHGEQIGASAEVIEALDTLARKCRQTGEHGLHTNSMAEFEEFREDILTTVDSVEDALEGQ